ncbi:MAG: VCBS repeat-containing protein [Phycisphaerae bacterium]|jgi:hypothetical protein
MNCRRISSTSCIALGSALLAGLGGCAEYPFFPVSGARVVSSAAGGVFGISGAPFTEALIQERTFTDGSAVTTVFHQPGDRTRTPLGIDFNLDGKIDPVVAYAQRSGGVLQILLSKGEVGEASFTPLTLDGNGRWKDLSDVAVGDIDGDGALDLVGASEDGVIYLHNPGPGLTSVLRDWGSESADLEFLAGSTDTLTNDEIEAIITQLLPPGVNIEDYEVTLDQGYTQVEIADLDLNGSNDVVSSRRFNLLLTPKSTSSNLEPIEIIAGELQLFVNPGGATDGSGWELISLGDHERFAGELDRQGAAGLLAYDFDGDGDMDLVSAARDDENVQITWFEHPGAASFRDKANWVAWRVGSLRDAIALDIADLTADGRADVVAVGAEQQQLVLFEQPATGPKREFDWDAYPIVTFEAYQPLDVKALDLDFDGQLELVLAGTEGAVRYFEATSDPRAEWQGVVVLNFDAPGAVGLLGYGDLDGDGDLDLVAVLNDDDAGNDVADRVVWIRNEASLLDAR